MRLDIEQTIGTASANFLADSWAGSTSLSAIIGNQLAKVLADELRVDSVFSLLSYIPSKYQRRGVDLSSSAVVKGDRITVVGVIEKLEFPKGVPIVNGRPDDYAVARMKFFRIIVRDGKRKYFVSFFHPRKLLHIFHIGQNVVLDGTVDFFRGEMQLAHPEWIILPDDVQEGDQIPIVNLIGSKKALGIASAGTSTITVGHFFRPVIPQYCATSTIASWEIWGIIRYVVQWAKEHRITDPLPDYVLRAQQVPSLIRTWEILHEPDTLDDIDRARRRIALDEAFAIQLALHERKQRALPDKPSPQLSTITGGLRSEFMQRLPFTLTQGQKDVLESISADMVSAEPMNRLLQGEVGSGKTIIALLAMLTTIDNGYQCCFLAPTEVLATQHYHTFIRLLGDLATAGQLGAHENATKVQLITGSLAMKAKKQALLDCVTGDAGIIVGTHALLEDTVDFFRLGLIIVDEQHRFGVQQRDKLKHKASGYCPHTLVMTATPIPRTVALTRYGDLQVSVLNELPVDRKPITTTVVPLKIRPQWWDRICERIGEEIAAGRQVYVVFPNIASDNSLDTVAEQLIAAEPLAVENFYRAFSCGEGKGFRVAMMHGKLSSEEKNQVMDNFFAGKIDILLSTTVIEVGVDVPNSTMMIIMDADRFGVSQLHQLRGRIGRGGHSGLCLLVTRLPLGVSGTQRLDAIAATTDGFELALIDLAQRREGDVLGDAQSGTLSSFRVLSLLSDEDIIGYAYDTINQYLNHDKHSEDFMRMYSAYSCLIDDDKIQHLAMA